MLRPTFALLLATLASPAFAETVDELRTEIEQRVAQNNWQAADRAYRSLVDQGRASAQDHLLGGQAARALGLVNDALARLESAQKMDKDNAEATRHLGEIAERYGEVKLKTAGSWEGGVPLRTASPIIDAEFRQVVLQAKKQLEAEHSYAGLLPLGAFKLGDVEFEVVADEVTKASLK